MIGASSHPTMFYCMYTTHTFRVRRHPFRDQLVVDVINVISLLSEGTRKSTSVDDCYSTGHRDLGK